MVAMSRNVYKSLAELGVSSDLLCLSPLALDLVKFSRGRNKDDIKHKLALEGAKIILFVGNVTESKGLDLLIDAFEILRKKINDIVLVVTLELPLASETRRRERIEKRLTELGNKVRLLGIIDYLFELMGAADVVVAPYRDTHGPSDYPLALIEAMACGRAVVGTTVGGIPELIEDGWNGRLVPPGDPEKLADACAEILGHHNIAKRYGKNGRSYVERRFSPNTAASKLLEIYCTTAKSGGRLFAR